MKTRQLRDELYVLLERVARGERFVIEKYRDALGALVPMTDYWELKRLQAARRRSGQETNMHTYRIVVTNASGGEGKTTTAMELAFALASRGFRVGLVDTDPQATLTKNLGLHDVPGNEDPATFPLETLPGWQRDRTVLPSIATRGEPLPEPIDVYGVHVWPANRHLSQANSLINEDIKRAKNLRLALDALDGYDFILIDTMPSETPLLNAAMIAADHVVVPVNGAKGVNNLDTLASLLETARDFVPHIGVRLFVPNRVSERLVHHRNVLATIETYAEIAPMSRPVARRESVYGAALERRQPVTVLRPASEAAAEYQQVVDDLLSVLGVTVAVESA